MLWFERLARGFIYSNKICGECVYIDVKSNKTRPSPPCLSSYRICYQILQNSEARRAVRISLNFIDSHRPNQAYPGYFGVFPCYFAPRGNFMLFLFFLLRGYALLLFKYPCTLHSPGNFCRVKIKQIRLSSVPLGLAA